MNPSDAKNWKGARWCVLLATVLLVPAALAEDTNPSGMSPDQEAMMAAFIKAGTPGVQHAELAEQVGTWNAKVSMWMEPGGEPQVSDGVFHRELMHDGRILSEDYQGSVMGHSFAGHSLSGYDNVTGRWWVLWTDNMSTGPMMMWGKWSDADKGVVFHGTTPDALTGTMMKIKTIVRRPSKGKEVMEMFDLRGPEPFKTMEIVATQQ